MYNKKMETIKIKQTKWNLTPLLSGDNDPTMEEKRKIVEQKSYEFINKWKDRDDYLKDPAILKEALDEYEGWERNYSVDGQEGYYFYLRIAQDQNDSNLKAKLNKIHDFGVKIKNDIDFFQLRISKIPPELHENFLAHEELKDYKHFLEKLFVQSKFLLSEPEEKILTLKSQVSHSNWTRMVSGFISKEEREILVKGEVKKNKNFSEISALISDKDKNTRDSAAKALNEILEKHSDSAEAEINSILANKKVDDELRKMERPDLSRHIMDDIDTEVVDILASSVSSRFDISKRYYELKAKLMGVKKLEYHERNVEYGESNKKFSYEEVSNLIYKIFKNLDQEFADIFAGFVENGQIDVYPEKGKASGAFCAYGLAAHPVYILLNYTEELRDALTVAHELGHGINDELVRKKQNALNFGTPTSTAEVASTFFEDFVLKELLEDADDELRLSIMMTKLNDEISTIFRQVACYKFEQDLHRDFREKGYLSKEDIGKLFQKHMSAYMGDFVEQSPGSENWWVSWSHIRNFFYNYSYASGLLISKSLQNYVKDDPGFIEKVKEFLSAGLSDSPKNIFKKLGTDISDKNFWDKGLNEIENLLQETEKLAKKLGKY